MGKAETWLEVGTDLKDFHLFSKPDRDGNRTAKDVFDSKIVEYLIKHMDLMIYNNVLYIYVGGVYVKDKDGRKIKSQIQALMYDEFKTSIRINRVYALMMCTNSLVVTEEEINTYPAHWINFKNGTLEYINHIVGRENVSHISPQSLSHRFQSAFLMQKLLNSVSDISSKPIRETNVIKQLSGEDAIPAEYKGGDVFSFYNTAKMLFTANTIPLVEDEQSNGYYRRLLIARMKEGDYIPNLKKNLLEESPEFIYFLTKHLKNVYERGEFLKVRGVWGKFQCLEIPLIRCRSL